MNAVLVIIAIAVAFWIGWSFGRSRGHGDQITMQRDDRAILSRRASSSAEVDALKEKVQTLQCRCSQLSGENCRLLGKLFYQNQAR